MAKLVFKRPPATSARLIFNEAEGSASSDATIRLAGSLGDFGGAVLVGIGQAVLLVGSMGAFSGEVAVEYSSQTQRPLASAVVGRFQDAEGREAGVQGTMQDGERLRVEIAVRWQEAQAVRTDASIAWQDTERLRRSADVAFQDGVPVVAGVGGGFAQAQRARHAIDVRFQDGVAVDAGFRGAFQSAVRHRNDAATRFQQGVRVSAALVHPMRDGRPVSAGPDPSLFQDARRPPPGVWTKPPVQPEDPCYIPGSARLVFAQPWSDSSRLIFICERHPPGPQPGETVVVPIRKAYIVQNSLTLTRVDGGDIIPAKAFAMSVDVDSWTWQWSATLPGAALPLIEPDAGEPVDVLANINGVDFRLCVERYARERRFARSDLRVSGRGRAAILDAPYAPVLNHVGASNATIQQLLAQVLSINGVSIGWDVDFQISDWLVPAGTWALQGTYIAGVLDIASAAGAIVQPHRTDATLRVLPRYPVAPWEWGGVTPDFELPAAAVSVEGIEWLNRPDYNRIFVAGTTAGGVLGQVTRGGTAGDAVAPMVTHPLITHTNGARQRGLSDLANTGRQAMVSLRLQVLPETGLIVPGQFVRYVDGADARLGLVRSTALDWQRPSMRQSITLETHLAEA